MLPTTGKSGGNRRSTRRSYFRARLLRSVLDRTTRRACDEEPPGSPGGRAFRNHDARLYLALQRLRHREQALEQCWTDLQIRNDHACKRAKREERALACCEHMVNLAIWKAHAREEKQKHQEAGRVQVEQPQDREPGDNYAKIEALRQAALGELEGVLASGEVVLPE